MHLHVHEGAGAYGTSWSRSYRWSDCLTWMLGGSLREQYMFLTTEPSLYLTSIFSQCPKYISKVPGTEIEKSTGQE